ncbi:CvfD/Ygs/GSP13 family RNA-binding post-transcriptional regulator [Ligilactobacillus faecis]|uniref:CvfD/Ygs/GSP13 family RNA-binding post-transcriptional regulator n=1 Tax=Ligilactobacillus faecis TaxID=762833 RepID=UPI0024692A62|nr:CvfD/Ygs/GSP13 family RNA-binding post-transcriptional regulator [Ligilactobacillus faecis]WGN89634.1 CvfD/Ygs/GSP13 family RNA-binding post-transcriptional regulator [Ligilactobacillus faecis]
MEIDYRIGMVLEGRVTGIQPYGAFVALDEETQGLIHISECHHGFVEDIQKYLEVGQKIKVMIIDIDEYTKKISLSVRCLEKPFDFSKPKYTRYQHKKYWTSRHVYEGFTPIKQRLDHWVDEALADISKGK